MTARRRNPGQLVRRHENSLRHERRARGEAARRWWRLRPAVRVGWWRADEGWATAFVVTLTVGILAVAGLTLDGGLALAAKVRAGGQAEAAARAGAQALDLTAYRTSGTVSLQPTQAAAAARAFLGTEGATGTVAVTGDTVTVEITATQPTQLLGLIGITSLHVHAHASASPQRGIDAIDP